VAPTEVNEKTASVEVSDNSSMNSISIESVEVIEANTDALRREFIRLPLKLYKGSPYYVQPLISERKEFFDTKTNPFFASASARLFLARKSGRTVGRIATCVYFAHNEIHHDKTGFFGFLDCIEDYDVCARLLKVAMITLKQEGMDVMRGPANFSLNHECGFLVEGYDSPPMLMMTYNPPYLPEFAEKFGLKKVMDLLAFRMTNQNSPSERVLRVVNIVKRKYKVKIRPINMRRFDDEVDLINDIYNKSWEANWGFVPVSKSEFKFAGRNLKQIVDPKLALIAMVDDKPIAFSLALPNLNQALIHLNGRLLPWGIMKLFWHTKIRDKVDSIRILAMGVLPEYRNKGIDNVMHVQTFQNCIGTNYKWGELSWILETNNLMIAVAESLGAKVYKRYRMVEMPI